MDTERISVRVDCIRLNDVKRALETLPPDYKSDHASVDHCTVANACRVLFDGSVDSTRNLGVSDIGVSLYDGNGCWERVISLDEKVTKLINLLDGRARKYITVADALEVIEELQ